MARYELQVHIGDLRHRLMSGGEDSVLDTIHASGLTVRSACANGVCGLCRCRLVTGEISYRERKPHALRHEHIEQGFILPCIAHAISDLNLDDFLPQAQSSESST